MREELELVRAGRGVTEAAGTARIEIHDPRGMTLTGLVDLRTRRGRLEGDVAERSFPKVPSDLGEQLSKEMGAAGSAMAELLGTVGDVMETVRGVGSRIEYVLDDDALYYLAGDRWIGASSQLEGFGGPPPWQDGPLWALDLLPAATSVRALDESSDVRGERCRAYAVEADAIAAAEATDRAIRLPSATLAMLRAFPAEVWFDAEGRVRRMSCGPPPRVPELGAWSAELFDFGVDEPIELPDSWPPADRSAFGVNQ